MPLPLKKRQVASVEYIIKRMKSPVKEDSSYDHSEDVMMKKEGEQSDYEIAYNDCASEMVEAMHSKDAKTFKKCFMKMFSMLMDEYKDEEKLEKQAEIEHLKRGEG